MNTTTMTRTLSLFFFVLLAAGSLTGCDKSQTIATADPVAAADLVAEIALAAKGCGQGPPVADCPTGVTQRAGQLTQELGASALPTLLAQLRDSDPKVSFVAAHLLGGPFYAVAVAPDEALAFPRDQAQNLLAYVIGLSPKTQPKKAVMLMRPAVSIGLASGADDQVRRLMEAMRPQLGDAHKQAYLAGLAELMARGHMRAFDSVAEAMKSEDKAIKAAAFEAPLRMKNWTPEEQEKLCPLAAAALSSKALELDGAISAMLLNCTEGPPKGRPLILEEARRRLEQSAYRPPFSDAVIKVCTPIDQEDEAMDSVCEDQREFLLKVLEQPPRALREHERFLALQTLATGWPERLNDLEGYLPTFSAQKQQDVRQMFAQLRQAMMPAPTAPRAKSTKERTQEQIEREEEEAKREKLEGDAKE